ncbi:TAXI family TRAP transporter solute-binding subunit [Methylobacterium sp.]|jgi:TRAP transporter TAXI family solute receptor|uniref:TAXI family TRAP transporter solute-binding subunit n=1 Tax=Methylobacterium sp. TaxID=409 RepID=UPI002600FB52|nr:TAXI family TRAP transporter solute-binding subunit [Methylobacterium sp.]MBY0259444.1 TAXI family TRAP transporter solute-binding subunit [Methylobacterium sp.]
MRRRTLVLGAALAALARPARAQADPETRLVLATATPGGSFPAFGQALAEAVRETDPGLVLTLRPSKGSQENLGLLRAGSVDLALVQGEYAYDALGVEKGSETGLSVVAPVSASPGLFVVRADSPIRGVADLRGRRVALGTHASGLTVMGRSVLRGSGIDPERAITPILLDRAGDGAAMVLDGRADALWGAGTGWPGFRVLADAPGGARFFGPAPEAMEPILALHPSLRRVSVPAGVLRGQGTSVETVGSWSFVLARAGVEAGAVARLVRAMDRGNAALARAYPAGADAAPRNLVAAVPAAWLHPESAAYLRETGALR